MMTRGRDRLLNRFGYGASKERSDVPPSLFGVQAIQIVAGGHARLAASARVEINSECILLTSRRQ